MSWMIVVVCRLEQSIGNLYRLSALSFGSLLTTGIIKRGKKGTDRQPVHKFLSDAVL